MSTNLSKLLVPVLLLLSCMLSTASFADSGTDFSNSGGTLSAAGAGLALSGSTLVAVQGLNGRGLVTGDLGTVTFSTGALMGGSLQMGAVFAAGGTFAIDGNGTNGVPNGVLFSGSFTEPVTWTLKIKDGMHYYTLSGVVTGTMGGVTVSGLSVQLAVNTGRIPFDDAMAASGGETTIGTIPEPSTLALFGTGAISLFGALRRKIRA